MSSGLLGEHLELGRLGEEEWYMIGADEDASLENALEFLADNEPAKKHKKGMKRFEQALDKLAERESKLVERREVIARGKAAGCKSLPEPHCDVYRVTPPGAATLIDDEWGEKRRDYLKGNGYPPGSKTHHRVPKCAGGCPGRFDADGNLTHDSTLSAECRQFDADLTKIQGDCAALWARRTTKL
ncbi:hypothetical protein ENSA5_26480 [Enhygromyxa salina]|uniref:Uncharacterized protein n=2 Tax=Enhygromyxa salina TaxID=215803 RepID=A0A2S9YAS4_9BACT|nr:hypothetical protein ENSA5_26480 [Enhygromyxa salina]